jgi:hypothetical protein
MKKKKKKKKGIRPNKGDIAATKTGRREQVACCIRNMR